MQQVLVGLMHGHQTIREHRSKWLRVHVFVHTFSLGFTLLELVLVLSLLPFLFYPTFSIRLNIFESHEVITFKKQLMKEDISCQVNVLVVNGISSRYACESLEYGYKIVYEGHLVYVYKP